MIKIKAHIYKTPAPGPRPWNAVVGIAGSTGQVLTDGSMLGTAASWPEVMQRAQVLMAKLDAELMYEVHASRSSRRAAQKAAA